MYYKQTWPSFRLPMGHGSLASVPDPGSGLAGLGDAETATECPQPTSTADRDRIRNLIKAWTNPHERKHFVEGHPDIGVVFDDIVGRLRGLEQRPKLLRCSKEARDRAHNWLGQLDDLGRRVRPNYPGAGFTTVPATFTFTVFRGPTYTIRSNDTLVAPGRTISDVMRGTTPAPPPAPSSAPPGSVVVGGQVYPSSAAAAAAAAGSAPPPPSSPASSAPTPPGPGATTGTDPLAYIQNLVPAGILEGDVMGIPTRYLVYGVGGLLAYKFLFGKGR